MAKRRKSHKKWPRYEIGPHYYIMALGVLAANFNYLESWLHFIFRLYVKTPDEAKSYLFSRMDNAARLVLLQKCFEASDHSEKVKAALRHFCSGFARCAENRNILMHAQAIPVVEVTRNRARIIFSKASRSAPYAQNTYTPSITQLRAMADATNAFSVYGRELAMYVWSNYEIPVDPDWKGLRPTWPKKPALPRLLAPQQPRPPSYPKAD